MKISTILFCAVYIFQSLTLMAQDQNLVHEQITLISNKTLYATGQKIEFNAFYSNSHNVECSKVLYVELISPSGTPIEQQKLEISDNIAKGNINIPLKT